MKTDSQTTLFSREEKKKARVLVAAVTFDKHSFCLDNFMESLKAQDFKDFDILFVDNSKSADAVKYEERLKATGAVVLKDPAVFDHKIKVITNGRKIVRRYFLDHKEYDHLFFVDTDVLLPSFALSRMLNHKKDIISGVVLTNMKVGDEKIIAPCVYDFNKDEPDTVRVIDISEVLPDRLMKIYTAGFGCALISRKVLEKVDIDYNPKSMAGEDVMFFVNAGKLGFEIFADTSVKCEHVLFPVSDRRNDLFRFDRYLKKSVSYSFDIKLG